jgi:hypothetical protein
MNETVLTHAWFTAARRKERKMTFWIDVIYLKVDDDVGLRIKNQSSLLYHVNFIVGLIN